MSEPGWFSLATKDASVVFWAMQNQGTTNWKSIYIDFESIHIITPHTHHSCNHNYFHRLNLRIKISCFSSTHSSSILIPLPTSATRAYTNSNLANASSHFKQPQGVLFLPLTLIKFFALCLDVLSEQTLTSANRPFPPQVFKRGRTTLTSFLGIFVIQEIG